MTGRADLYSAGGELASLPKSTILERCRVPWGRDRLGRRVKSGEAHPSGN